VSLHLVIAAAGSGHRLGSPLPKALVSLGGRPILSLALEPFASIPFAKIVVLAAVGYEAEFESLARSRAAVVPGGETRADSVARGVAELQPSPRDFVVIHDAARPFVSGEEIRAVIEGAEESGAATAVLPVPDTLKRVEGRWILDTVDRRELVAAATPQVIRADLLRRALAEVPPATDEAARCEAIGIRVAAVPVSRRAFKITYPEDLELAAAILAGKR
jgi:2-C-methyl-D-erythritol 4-phosphate cytidylyltransferase